MTEKPNDKTLDGKETLHNMRWICKDCGYVGKSHSHRNCIDDYDKVKQKALAEVREKLLKASDKEIEVEDILQRLEISRKDFNKVFEAMR